MEKRGQASGAGAATLILILTIMIILYIVFLPSEERVNVLGNDPIVNGGGMNGGGSTGPGTGRALLSEHPGRLDYLAQRQIEHAIPTINLYTTTAATELKHLRSVYVRRGVFDEVQSNITFTVTDLAQTNKAMLTFNRKDSSGRLSIYLNGQLIFQDELNAYNVDPIPLPKDLLHESNQVLFTVDSPGWRFWHTNSYSLEDVKVTADVTDVSTTAANGVFLVTSAERDNADRAALKFFPDCVPGKVGILTVALNGHPVFTGVPDCGVLRSTELSPAYFLTGENTLEFSTQKGVYLIDQISVRSELKTAAYPTYYFDIDQTTDSALTNGARAILSLDFVDDVNYKKAQIFVNGKTFAVNTRDKQWWAAITPYLRPGTNAVEIIPQSTLDVVNLEVALG